MSEAAEHGTPYQVIAPDGTSRVARADIGLKDEDLRELLRSMIRARALDEECMRLQAAGQLTVYPPFRGQEAAQAGSAYALEHDDFVFPSFRELAAALVRGVDPVEYLQYHRGTWHGGPYDPLENRFGPICVTLANQIVHAVGYAMGMRLDRKPVVTLAYFGDGSTSEGDFHEACNFAGVYRAPVVLFCQNNQWAISVPLEEQTAAPIHLRAQGYGFPGVLVDGNDAVAVWQVTRAAADRARAGEGPTLIEAMTYRMGPHTTAVSSEEYRSKAELERWQRLDPIARLRAYLLSEGVVDEPWMAGCEDAAGEEAARVGAAVEQLPAPPPESLFEWVYAEMPPDLARQRDEMLRGGDG